MSHWWPGELLSTNGYMKSKYIIISNRNPSLPPITSTVPVDIYTSFDFTQLHENSIERILYNIQNISEKVCTTLFFNYDVSKPILPRISTCILNESDIYTTTVFNVPINVVPLLALARVKQLCLQINFNTTTREYVDIESRYFFDLIDPIYSLILTDKLGTFANVDLLLDSGLVTQRKLTTNMTTLIDYIYSTKAAIFSEINILNRFRRFFTPKFNLVQNHLNITEMSIKEPIKC